MCKHEKHAGLKLISLRLTIQVKTSHVNMPLGYLAKCTEDSADLEDDPCNRWSYESAVLIVMRRRNKQTDLHVQQPFRNQNCLSIQADQWRSIAMYHWLSVMLKKTG